MKNYIIFLLATISICCTSCETFLDTKPQDFLTPNQYYTTEDQLNTALVGVYDIVGQESVYGSAIFSVFGACTDEGFYARNTLTSGVSVYNFDYSNNDVRNLWAKLYDGIERANILIEHINVPTMDSTKRSNILGQALFLRAYYHFMLVSNFGDVPLKIMSTSSVNNTAIPRTPMKEVYAQILKDMTQADTLVQTITQIGNYSSKISKTTVEGILARVCLYMAGYPMYDTTKYTDALAWAKKVQLSGEHELLTTFDATQVISGYAAFANKPYSQIFINHAQNIYNVKECMWEADFYGNFTDSYREAGRIGNTIGVGFNGSNSSIIGYSYGFINVTNKLYRLYGTGDTRRDWAIAPYSYSGNTLNVNTGVTNSSMYSRNVGKWRRSFEIAVSGGKNQNYTPENFPILRYADVLLMLSEAENEVNGPTDIAYAAINQVRRRAYNLPITTANVTADLIAGLSKDDFRKAIQDERARELCFEGLRKNDLIRWGIFISTMKALAVQFNLDSGGTAGTAYGVLGYNNVAERHLLLPIPAAEISVNRAMKQNQGW